MQITLEINNAERLWLIDLINERKLELTKKLVRPHLNVVISSAERIEVQLGLDYSNMDRSGK